jgi:hypothetical protein
LDAARHHPAMDGAVRGLIASMSLFDADYE